MAFRVDLPYQVSIDLVRYTPLHIAYSPTLRACSLHHDTRELADRGPEGGNAGRKSFVCPRSFVEDMPRQHAMTVMEPLLRGQPPTSCQGQFMTNASLPS